MIKCGCFIILESIFMAVLSREQRRPAGSAYGVRYVCRAEYGAFPRDLVDMGRFRQPIPVGTTRLKGMVIRNDDNDIRLCCFLDFRNREGLLDSRMCSLSGNSRLCFGHLIRAVMIHGRFPTKKGFKPSTCCDEPSNMEVEVVSVARETIAD